MRHDTRFLEAIARRYHQIWAGLCLFQSAAAVLIGYMLYPFVHVLGFLGVMINAQFYLQWGLVAFGIGGAVFHLVGARDHARRGRKK